MGLAGGRFQLCGGGERGFLASSMENILMRSYLGPLTSGKSFGRKVLNPFGPFLFESTLLAQSVNWGRRRLCS